MKRAEPPPLTAAQRELMEIFWQHGEATVSQVREQLQDQGRSIARNTVQTMIVRLEEKGWLQHRKQGRTFVYSAVRERKRSLGVKVSQLVDRFFAGSPEDMVNALIEHRGLTSEESQRIRKMIQDAELDSGSSSNVADNPSSKRGRRRGKQS
ncbi:BlaI/MecI/CopY family transcriptional regulator [Stieleria sp. ICT_E10.1]|uniref:BlaI/MecI/CopY family transcriptional regulator n=1 Tax=Stieleria sedimenti TaxID=2976331 RepID=UPI00217F593F|nr:BlaI/MecI/CopY family transcriptional regulator [Stieleria sedimenti]MCS7471424.1 BlaI/MecI/CopY family transcriptional regulator [Stieleria sedimenti]